MKADQRIAVLIDAENISAQYTKIIFDEISTYGTATYKRCYGDWTKPHLSPWKSLLLNYSITPVQQYSYTSGKNASDSALIIDAMDILHSGHADGFCLVSSDSDFTRLATRLRESGMYVIGMGEKKTPQPFISACELFKYLDVLAAVPTSTGKSAVGKDKREAAKPSTADTIELTRTVQSIVEECSDDEGWAPLSEVGNRLSKRQPDFDTRNYGHTKLTNLMASLKQFHIRSGKPTNPDVPHKYIRNKE